MKKIVIKVINQSENPLPGYETGGSAGVDIRASLSTAVTLQPLERKLIPTGLFIELPQGYEAQVRPRSGLAIKNGITCLNTPGTIDSDYRGEIKVILINLSAEVQKINNGDRIAQLVFNEVARGEWVQVETISSSDRGEGGFGHTGNN